MSRRGRFAAALPAGTGTFAGAPSATEDKRLSLKQCRAFLPTSCRLSEHEIEVLRDGLYALADIVNVEFAKRRPKREEQYSDMLSDLDIQRGSHLQVQ